MSRPWMRVAKAPSHGLFPVKLIRLRRPLACHPRSGAKRGGAGLSRERSDLDAPAAGYTVTTERAAARSWRPLWSLLRSFILALRISFCVWIRSVSPSFACSLDGRITSHPVELVGARTIIPHARGRRARVGGDHPHMGCFRSSSFVCAGRWRVTREAGRSAAEQGAKRP